MNAARLRVIVEPMLGLLALGLAWQAASLVAANATLVPSARAIGGALAEMARGDLAADVLASLTHLAIGYGTGVATGLALALLAARFPTLAAIVDPFAEFLRPISAIAWIPIAILAFGVGRAVPIFLIFYASLFPIFVNALDGIRRVDPSLVNAARMLGASRRMQVLNVVLPAALPAILAGARLSLGVGWVAMVAGELVGADAGLGYRIMWFQEYFAIDGVMATIVVIGLLGYLADAVLRLVERALLVTPAGAGR